MVVVCDSDFEPDELLPEYLEARTKLFKLERPLQDAKNGLKKGRRPARTPVASEEEEMEIAKLRARIDRIARDPLFDGGLAELEWRARVPALEKDHVAMRIELAKTPAPVEPPAVQTPEVELSEEAELEEKDEVTLEAEKIAAEILAQNGEDSDGGLGDLFANLPVTEVDEATGESNTVVNNSDGSRLTIRDFAKWTGVSPLRILEEACRSR
jgi:ATP-dependent RNA helicase DHX29